MCLLTFRAVEVEDSCGEELHKVRTRKVSKKTLETHPEISFEEGGREREREGERERRREREREGEIEGEREREGVRERERE